jgi:transposase InsO family protein
MRVLLTVKTWWRLPTVDPGWSFGEPHLRVSWFTNLFDARRKIGCWKDEYNQQRPHSSLGYRTPAEFARALARVHGLTASVDVALLRGAWIETLIT